MAGKRIEWLDVAKGIGILLVVAGHCIPLSRPACQLIFVFHMPLFFMLSGYTFSDGVGFGALLKKKAKTLLLPFAACFGLGLAVTLLIPVWRQSLTWQGIKADLILADPNNVHNSSIWFLVCLFFVTAVFWLVNKLPVFAQLIVITGLYAAGVWYASVRTAYPIFGYARLPLNLDVVPSGLVFYALGHYARKYKAAERVTCRAVRALVLALPAALATAAVYRCNGYVNTHGLQYHNPILFVLGGIFGSLAVFGISALIARASSGKLFLCLKRVLMWYGRSSLTVLGVQSLLIRLYALYFNTQRGASLSLYAFPMKHAVFSAFLTAFVFCPLIIFALGALKKAHAHLFPKKEKEKNL